MSKAGKTEQPTCTKGDLVKTNDLPPQVPAADAKGAQYWLTKFASVIGMVLGQAARIESLHALL